MKSSSLLWLLFLVALPCSAEPTEEVLAAFKTYKEAVLSQNGKAAVPIVSQRTLECFEGLLKHTLLSPKNEVGKLRTAGKFTILRARHQVPHEKLREMTAADFFAYGIEKGWTSKQSTIALELGQIEISGNTARAEVIVSGQKAPPPLAYVFLREDGKWKLDMLPLLNNVDAALKQAIRTQGIKEDEFLFNLIESLSGRKVAEDVWKPVSAK